MKLFEIQRPTRAALLEQFKQNDTGYLTEDLISIVLSHFDDQWQQINEDNNSIVVQLAPLFNETLADKTKTYPDLKSVVDAFVKSKTENPLAAFGKSDKRFSGNGNLIGYVPKLAHAHLYHDLSIFYTLDGMNPRVLRLYGLFSHDDSGTGTPANIKRQHNLGKRLAQQTFPEPTVAAQPPAQQTNNKKKPKR